MLNIFFSQNSIFFFTKFVLTRGANEYMPVLLREMPALINHIPFVSERVQEDSALHPDYTWLIQKALNHWIGLLDEIQKKKRIEECQKNWQNIQIERGKKLNMFKSYAGNEWNENNTNNNKSDKSKAVCWIFFLHLYYIVLSDRILYWFAVDTVLRLFQKNNIKICIQTSYDIDLLFQ